MSWIAHVKKVAAEKGISYSVALKSAETKEGYTKVERKVSAKPRVKKEPVEGEVVKEKKPRAPRKKKDEVALEIIYDKKVPEKKKRFKKVEPSMKLKSEVIVLDGKE
tara:strand:+ start:1740 stop:2060 length:321 start_codon:yes stop_codon:yes gene_type:complete